MTETLADLRPRPGPGPWQTAHVTAITPLTRRLKSFLLAPARPFAWAAGQHVEVRLTAPDGYQARRSYSIASAPESGLLELAIERLEDGEVSGFFHDVVEPGDEIELRGAIGGHFIWVAGEGRPLLAIGGGSGIVPLVSMVRHRAAAGSRVPAVILTSARSYDDLPYRDELIALGSRADGLGVGFAVTREPSAAAGVFTRRVDAAMLRDLLALTPLEDPEVYVCGSNPFVEAATRAVQDVGIEARRIRTERYGG